MRRAQTFAAIALVLGAATVSGAAQPNFLLILADDLGYGDLSLHGAPDVRTPNLDRLATEGIRFSAMRANATVCSPTRAAILTGLYPDRVGVPGVIRSQPADSWGWFSPGVPTLADRLRELGYHTALVGKWHLGLESPNLPNERGFDLFRGFLGDMMDSYTHHRRHGLNYMRHNREVVDPPGHATDIFTDWAVAYLRGDGRPADRPFFLYLAYNAPHFPIEPPPEWLERVRRRCMDLDVKRAKNVALVEHLDDAIGRVLAALHAVGAESNTLVVATSDNGGSLPHAQSNRPWRGGKQDHYDGGLRVPFLARWPAVIAPGRVSDYEGLTFDVTPTFLEAAGGRAPAELDAVSLLPILRGGAPPRERRELYFVRREGGPRYGGKSYEALIADGWKLMQNDPFSPWELYNLRDDPQEQTDLAAACPEVVRRLSEALRNHIRRGGAAPWQPSAVR
ncbi:MAG: sulfatase-like hydrolase/transferase [Kiritimatiellae bacterium]|nr:sulfatase-like hydrolase/transferase [Kiritimatiellia bacterium]